MRSLKKSAKKPRRHKKPTSLNDPFLAGWQSAVIYWEYVNPYVPDTLSHRAFRLAWRQMYAQIRDELRGDPQYIDSRQTTHLKPPYEVP